MDNNSATNQKHIIDLAGDPMPVMWKKKGYEHIEIEKHVGEGLLELDPSRFQLYLSQGQQGIVYQPKRFPDLQSFASSHELVGRKMDGHVLLKDLEENKIPVLNACVLNYLLLHPELIPEDWKVERKNIVFWGTIFRAPSGMFNTITQYVLFMSYLRGWHTFELSLNCDFGAGRPAAIRAPLQS